MADPEAPPKPEDGSEEAGGLLSNKLVVFGGAGAVLVGAGAVVYFLFLSGGAAPPPEASKAGEGGAGPQQSIEKVAFIALPDIMVNLTGDTSDPHYLKLKVKLEYSGSSVVSSVEEYMPRILDTFQVYLREMRREDLHNAAAVYRVKEELLRRLNVAIGPARVDAVLFEEFVVQ